jgi:hypothetical protein
MIDMGYLVNGLVDGDELMAMSWWIHNQFYKLQVTKLGNNEKKMTNSTLQIFL